MTIVYKLPSGKGSSSMLCPKCGRDNTSESQFCNGCGTNLDTPVAETPTASEESGLLTSAFFVGRQREMADLKTALEDAMSGRGRLVMLAGEPGIGKTRTAQELGAHAETLGAQVLWGRCFEEEGTPPYWPWVQPIRSYIRHQDPEELGALMGAGAAIIAEIVSQVREKLPNLQPPPTLEPEQARFRLFDSITTFLKTAARSRPLMLVLDDLHWCDRPSLLLLQFLARQLGDAPLLVVGTYRDVELSRQHPLSETLAQLSREPVFQRELLRGLSPEDAGHFIEATTGVQPHPGLAETIHAHTEGNPFFMTEVVQLLSEQDRLTAIAEGTGLLGMRIPEGVREVIGARLNRLSGDCNEMLSTASVIGREFGFELLRALRSEISYDRLLEALEEALAARLIDELEAGQYQFAHAMIQETLSAELSMLRRVRLHATIAETLEELYGATAEAHAAELAHHFAEAATAAVNEKLVHYSLLAGERALATYGHEEALTHFERALVAKEGQPMDSETAALLFGLGRAQLATQPTHRWQEATNSLTRAFDYYDETGDVDRAVVVAEHPFSALFGRGTEMTQLTSRALALVPSNSQQAGRLLSRYGILLFTEMGDYEGAQEAFGKALAIAHREGDPTLEMRTLTNYARADLYRLRYQECLEKSLRVIQLASRVDDPYAEMVAHDFASRVLIRTGDSEAAQQHVDANLLLAECLSDGYSLVSGLGHKSLLSSLKGDWRVAREFSDRALATSSTDIRLLSWRIVLEYEVGDLLRGQAYLERLLEVMHQNSPGPTLEYAAPALVIPLVARITGTEERLDTAERAAEIVLSSPSAIPGATRFASRGLALLAVLRGYETASREQYALLSPQRGLWDYFCTDRLLGLLAQTMGSLGQAAAHFEDALAFCRKAGYRPELAWTCCDYGDTLLQRNGAGDRQKAMSLLDESQAISNELGMRPLMERVTERLERIQAQPSTAPAYPDGLTQREVEVLGLMAIGKTDRAIAEELIISINTVGNHVRSILNKTGTANRTEAASYAVQRKLV